MTHEGLRRAHYAAGLKAHRKQVDTPRRVQHRLPVFPPRPTWYLAFWTGTNAIFYHADGRSAVIRGLNEGWTLEDIQTFGAFLASRNEAT